MNFHFRWILSACLLWSFNSLSFAQPISSIDLPSALFITGDDPQYKEARFPDEHWTKINPALNWEKQGFDGYNGFAWYRFHFMLPSALKDQAWWPDTVRIFLAKIDDADEIYLNGALIAKDGSYPADPGGYQTQWDQVREIHLASNNPLFHYNQENVIAIRVYDGDGPGGMYGESPFINMLDIHDGIKFNFHHNELSIANAVNRQLSGELEIQVIDPAIPTSIQQSSTNIQLAAHSLYTTPLSIDPYQRLILQASFTDMESGQSIRYDVIPPYLLTPGPGPTPRINSPSVFGVRPGSPFLFKIASTGERPLQYAVDNLPKGLKLDPAKGIITGKLKKRGEYQMQLVVSNQQGVARKDLTVKCGDLIALTPPMGWNSWNCWGLSVSDGRVRASAQALLDKGLADHGWTYMNIDDGWEAPKRNHNGEIVSNDKFRDMPSLGKWLHKQGLRFGIYSSPGPETCGGYLGSYQHELQDASTYAKWGIDYLKYDWCSYGHIHDEQDTTVASYIKPYSVMQHALRAQPRDIVYSLCQYGMKKVWTWGHLVDGNCWRTTGDIEDTWESMYRIAFNQVDMQPYAQPGRWNDPDMLIVGNVGWGDHLHPTRLTADEEYTHISLWCLLSAPLLIGCDISSMDDFTLNLLSNDDVLAIDQDAAGIQASRVIKNEACQVWMKPLHDGSHAIGIFNVSDDYQTISLPFHDLKLEGSHAVRDLWRQKDLGIFETFTTLVPPHGVMLIKVN